jgi:hypothetical protein
MGAVRNRDGVSAVENRRTADDERNAMPKFLIEFRHADDYEGCVKALDVLSTLGSHLVSHADFGCEDGVHCGWMVVEVGDRNEAELIVPPPLRAEARVIQLRRWSPEEISAMVSELGA